MSESIGTPGAPTPPPIATAPVTTSFTPPGWYPDPYGAAAYRWWDGSTWTSYDSTYTTGGLGLQRQPWEPLAIIAFVFSFIAPFFLFTFIWVAVAAEAVAIALAVIAIVRIRKGTRRGLGLAIAAIPIAVVIALVSIWGHYALPRFADSLGGGSSSIAADTYTAKKNLNAVVVRITACHTKSGAYPSNQDQLNHCVQPYTDVLSPGTNLYYYNFAFKNAYCVEIDLNDATVSYDSRDKRVVEDYCGGTSDLSGSEDGVATGGPASSGDGSAT